MTEETAVPDDRTPVGAGELRERVERLTKFEMADWPGQDFLLYEDVIALAATDPGVPSGAGLDVERLAVAITVHRVGVRYKAGPDAYLEHACMGDCAGNIAAEYSRLTPERADARCALGRFGLTPHSHQCSADEDRAALVTERADAPAGEEERPGCGDPEHPLGAYCTGTTGLHTCYPPDAAASAPPASPEPLGNNPRWMQAMEYEAGFEAGRRAASADHRPPASPEPLREALTEQRVYAAYSKRRSHGVHLDRDDDCREYVIGECFLDAALATATTASVETAPDERLRTALTEWQALATDYSEALLRLGHHQRSKHESPQQYDSDSSLACTAPGCLAELATATTAPVETAPDERLREAHRLLMPPHPGEAYQSSALCSCGEWQYDEDSFGALTNEYRAVLTEHTAHARAALNPEATR